MRRTSSTYGSIRQDTCVFEWPGSVLRADLIRLACTAGAIIGEVARNDLSAESDGLPPRPTANGSMVATFSPYSR